jgi:hypothetical protein
MPMNHPLTDASKPNKQIYQKCLATVMKQLVDLGTHHILAKRSYIKLLRLGKAAYYMNVYD